MPYALETRDVSYHYPGRAQPILGHVSLQIESGEFTLLVGPSGCGKSTLMLCLNGVIPRLMLGHFTGQVLVHGQDANDLEVCQLATHVGMVLQDPEAQLFNLVVEDEVAFAPESLQVPTAMIEERVRKYLVLVGMTHHRQSYTYALSGGEKQRIALASVLAAEPSILLLDEPTSNLDPRGTRDFLGVVERLASERQMTILAVEHQVEYLADKADRILVMDKGSLVADGSPREIFAKRELCERLGVWTPQVTRLAFSLSTKGMTCPRLPLTVQETQDAMDRSGLKHHPAALPDRPFVSSPQGAPGAMLIDVQDLSYAYHGSTKAIDHITFCARPGEFIAVAGCNGSGKTTLMKHLVGILRSQSGRVLIDGQDIHNAPADTITAKIGYVFQYPEHQFVTERVYDEVAYSLRVRGVAEEVVCARVDEVLELFGLTALKDEHPFTLSMGEKRRLSVGTMVVVDQKAIILDEPTMGQDWRQTVALLELLTGLNKDGKTIIVVTHDMQVVAQWARRVLLLDGGRLVLDGTPRELFADKSALERTALLCPQVTKLVCALHPDADAPRTAITNEEFLRGLP